jgi:hypothetical protein
MNLQTKIVMIAFAAGLTGAVLVFGGIIPDSSTPLVTDFQIGYWVGHKTVELCGVPLVAALVATVATAYKGGLRSSILNALGAAVGAVAVAAVITGTVYAVAAARPQHPFAEDGKNRVSFVNGAIAGCTRKLQEDPRGLPAATIEAYCSCFGNAMADVTTKAELASMDEHRTPGPEYAEKARAAFAKCSQLAQDQ